MVPKNDFFTGYVAPPGENMTYWMTPPGENVGGAT